MVEAQDDSGEEKLLHVFKTQISSQKQVSSLNRENGNLDRGPRGEKTAGCFAGGNFSSASLAVGTGCLAVVLLFKLIPIIYS